MTRRPIAATWAEAPAKVNLGLVVTGRRADGYHTLDSILVRLALHDHLEARARADPGGPDELEVRGDPTVPTEGNLVLWAVAALRRAIGSPLPALRLRLDKHIPAAAGLGGGSSDAAAALRLAARCWGLAPADVPWQRLTAGLGADVPFFVSGHAAARARGIGEVLDVLPEPQPAAGVVLITLPERLSTAAVFASLDREPDATGERDPGQRSAPLDELATALRAGRDGPGLATLAPRLRDANDLWAPAARLLPVLPVLRDRLEARLERVMLLSGSGPTLVALYPSAEAAAEAAASLAEDASPDLASATIIATMTSTTSRGGPP